MKRWIALIMSLVPLVAMAEGFWDGNAALQKGDSAFDAGLFAASDSFAVDTQLLVENLDTGGTVRVTVIEGPAGQDGILLLLSAKAAEALAIPAGTVARVRVTIAARAPSGLASIDQDRAENPDPEINPAVARAAAGVEEAPVEQASPAESAPTAEPAPTATEETPAEAEAPPAELTEDQLLLNELAARSPQKQLFLPPREDEKFAYQQAVEPPPAESQLAAAQPQQPAAQPEQPAAQPQQPTEPAPAPAPAPAVTPEPAPEVAPEPAVQPATIPVPEAQPPQAPPELAPEVSERIASAAEPAAAQAARLPVPEPLADEVTPAAPSAPAAAPAASVPAPAEATAVQAAPAEPARIAAAQPARKPAPAAPPVSVKGRPYYVQLAAYAAESLASGLAATLAATYPVLVRPTEATGRQLYRVMVGPLNKAESGTLLREFRARGFPDAFVRQE